MNTLINILIILFAIFGFALILYAYIPLIKKLKQKQTSKSQNKKELEMFCKSLTPEVIEKLKSLEG